MTLMTLLEQAQRGRLFAGVAARLGLGEAETRRAMELFCPAIAARMQARAAREDDVFQSLLDVIAEGGQAAPLEDPESLAGAEAIAEGSAILADLYGSQAEAAAALRQLDGAIPERNLGLLAPVSAIAVVAALAEANRPLALASGPLPARGGSAAEGFLSALISAIIAGIVAALRKQARPPARRRAPSYSKSRTARRKPGTRTAATRRGAAAKVTAEDLFRDILGKLGR